jgi:Ion channel
MFYIVQNNSWIISVFAVYVALLFVFAFVYLLIHRFFPDSFAFNADVLRSQDMTFRSMKVRESGRNRPRISALEGMQGDLEKGQPAMTLTRDPYGVTLRSAGGYEASFVRRHPYYSPAMAKRKVRPNPPWNELSLRHPNDRDALESITFADSEKIPQNVGQFKDLLDRVLNDLRAEADANLDVATSPVSSPQMWSFWDFLYFSTITQSTVGYGDILPNSTLVRMVVALQVLFGCALVVVFINLAVSRR